MSRFGIQQIKLNNVLYPGVKGYQLDRGVEVSSEGADGVIYQTAHHVTRRKPMADLTTFSLKAIVAALAGGTDFPFLALDGANGLIMYGGKQATTAPGYNSSSVHETRTGLNGVIYLAGVRWSPGNPAEAILKALMFSTDGSAASIASSSVAALPTAPFPDLGFALSALTINGSAIPEVNSLEIDIDPRFDFDYSAGLVEPVSLIGAGANGKLAITLKADVGALDLGAGTGSVSAVFTQYTTGGGFGSATQTFTFNSPWSNEEGIGGENGRLMNKGLLVRTRHNGTTKPLTWSST
jgi:hypothetical protein